MSATPIAFGGVRLMSGRLRAGLLGSGGEEIAPVTARVFLLLYLLD